MDDGLVHSPTLEQHLLDVEEVLEIFRRRKLYAESSKCEFGRPELRFLGHRLSAAGVSVDPTKLQSIRKWAAPKSCFEVRRFTGLTNYYRRFVERYAEVTAPLRVVPEAQMSFEALKQALSSAPVLRTFDPRRRAVLMTDASGLAVAAILTQPDDEGSTGGGRELQADRGRTLLPRTQSGVAGAEPGGGARSPHPPALLAW